jgi:hypothetical protein
MIPPHRDWASWVVLQPKKMFCRSRDGIFLSMRFASFLGAPIRIDSFEPYIHPDDWPAASRTAQRLLLEPGPNLQLQLRVRHVSGQYRPMKVSGVCALEDPLVYISEVEPLPQAAAPVQLSLALWATTFSANTAAGLILPEWYSWATLGCLAATAALTKAACTLTDNAEALADLADFLV